MHPDVAEAGGTEERIGAGMGDRVRVAVALESGFAVEVTTAEDEDPSGIGTESVDVEALPDAEIGNGDVS